MTKEEYARRKSIGICVRCNKKDSQDGVLCSNCKEIVHRYFHNKSKNKKLAYNKQQRDLRKTNWDKVRGNERKYHYHITVDEYKNMLSSQDYKCAICEVLFELRKRIDCPECDDRRTPHIDHNHACCNKSGSSCGKCIRKILCRECNHGLGRFRDSVLFLRAAANYVENFNKELSRVSTHPNINNR